MPARSKFHMKAMFSVNPWVFSVYNYLEIPFNCGFLLMVERTKGLFSARKLQGNPSNYKEITVNLCLNIY